MKDFMEDTTNQTAFCANHLTSKVEKDQFGNWYPKCTRGHYKNEECKIIVEQKGADKHE